MMQISHLCGDRSEKVKKIEVASQQFSCCARLSRHRSEIKCLQLEGVHRCHPEHFLIAFTCAILQGSTVYVRFVEFGVLYFAHQFVVKWISDACIELSTVFIT